MNDYLKELSLAQAQSIADSYSVGKVVSVKKFEDKEIIVTTRLSSKNLRANIFLAASYANMVPSWLDQNRAKDDWNLKELSEELKEIGITKHTDTYTLTSYSLKTTHGQYLLIGFSTAGNLSISEIRKLLKSKLKIAFVQEIPTSYQSEIYCSHQYDSHWYLFSSIQLSRIQSQEILGSLVGKPISILIGYGAPILADIGETDTNGFPEAKFFTDEYWWVEQNGKKITDRWKVHKDFFESKRDLIIDAIDMDGRAKHTFIKLNNDQVIVVERDEQLSTWHFDFLNERFSLNLAGKGEFTQSDYYPTIYKPKKRKLTSKANITEKEEKFLEYQEISQETAHNLISPLLNLKISEIFEETGKSFGLELGDRFDEWRHQGLISIDGNWVLTKLGKKIASSETHAFNYLNALVKTVLKEKLVLLPSIDTSSLSFSSGLTLELSLKSKRKHISLVTFFNRQEGYHIGFDGKIWEYTGPQNKLSKSQQLS